MSYFLGGGAGASATLGGLLAIALNLSSGVGLILGGALVGLFLVSAYLYTNPDNSLDIFFSYLTISLIPVYIAMPGPQPIVVRLGTSDVVLVI